jgi:hypothetical protein
MVYPKEFVHSLLADVSVFPWRRLVCGDYVAYLLIASVKDALFQAPSRHSVAPADTYLLPLLARFGRCIRAWPMLLT